METLQCLICLQDVGADGVVLSCARAGCKAVFHSECAARAWEANDQCPQCRRAVSPVLTTVLSLAHEMTQNGASLERMRKEVELLRAEGQALRVAMVAAHAEYVRVMGCARLLEEQMHAGFSATNARVDECSVGLLSGAATQRCGSA